MCWLIAICAFCLSISVVFHVGINCLTLGPVNYFKQNKITFYESEGFLNKLYQDFNYCLALSENNADKFTEELQSQKKAITDDVLNKFLDYKAKIIEDELRYAVENWDDSYYQFDGDVDVTLPEEYTTNVYVNVNAPENIQMAQKILVNAKGQEFLHYESLVRTDAFERCFTEGCYLKLSDDFSNYPSDIGFELQANLSKEQAAESVLEQYDSYVRDVVEYNYHVSLDHLSALESRENLKYYIVDLDGDVYANIEKIPQNLKNNERYILANKDNYEVKGFEASYFEGSFENRKYNVICLFFDESFEADDAYGNLYNAYNIATSEKLSYILISFVVSLAFAIAMLFVWLKLVGGKADGKAKLLFIDKIPTDIHIAISGLSGFALCVVLHDLLGFGSEFFDNLIFTYDFKIISICASVLFLTLITELISSVVRIKKTGESFFKRTLIYMILYKICCGIAYIFRKLKKIFEYKPKVFKWQVTLCCALSFLINAFICLFISFAEWFTGFDGVFMFTFGAIIIVFDLIVCYFVIKYINNLDKIIVASGEHKNVVFDDKRVDKSLLTLAQNLENSNEALDKAVAEAIKNEQMKTQLITNVSHDLKTPLTSLINYSDLLSKCEIEDEKAVEYIGVINNQSAKLKRLIEDLIEASKVSTGNVQLNKIKLNLSELAVQAIVEFTPDFDANKNEIKFTEPESAPIVIADSVKTYRIISNLFSNAKKYSAPNTRVYATVYEDGGYGYFEIKNISKEPLNISPETLTERFVRGDESRAKEGNGLGLSIAKDLCNLQNGELKINIDGDLFKAIVKLPKA